MRFAETRVFTAVIGKYLSHDRYRLLQLALALRPDAGSSSQVAEAYANCGGVRRREESAAGFGLFTTPFSPKVSATCSMCMRKTEERISPHANCGNCGS